MTNWIVNACLWHKEQHQDYIRWMTDCGDVWILEPHESPKDDHFDFCPECRRPIAEMDYDVDSNSDNISPNKG